MLPLLVTNLLSSGLSLLGNAALVKGKDWLEKETGIDLSKQQLSPEDQATLRKYEMNHEEELIRLRQDDDKLLAEVEMAYLADVQSARGMQAAALAQTDVFSKRFVYYFAIGWSVVSAIYIGLITFRAIPEANIRFADTTLGFLLGSILSGMFQFFYGSSKGSKDKDEVIRSLQDESRP